MWPKRRLAAVIVPVVIALAVGVVLLSASDESGGPAPDQMLYVDRDSTGGRCSDARVFSEAQSAQTPLCSVERAGAVAPSGATVLVRRGDYPPFTLAGKRGAPVAFKPFPGEAPRLRGGEISAGKVKLSGFRVTGTIVIQAGVEDVALVGNELVTDGPNGGSSVSVEEGAGQILIERNRIAQEPGVLEQNAINFSTDDTSPPIVDVTIRDNRVGPIRGGGDAIQAKNTRGLVVENNEFFDISRPEGSDAHPDVLQSIYGAKDLVVRGNFIHDVAAQGIFLESFRGANTGFVAKDNVIVRVAAPWVGFSFGAVGARVEHNTISTTLAIDSDTRDASIMGNISSSIYPREGAQYVEDYNLATRFVGPPGANSMTGSPTYADPAGDDFALAADSLGYRAGPGGKDVGSRTLIAR